MDARAREAYDPRRSRQVRLGRRGGQGMERDPIETARKLVEEDARRAQAAPLTDRELFEARDRRA